MDYADLAGVEWRWWQPPLTASHRVFSPTRRTGRGRGRGTTGPRAGDGPHGVTTIGRPNSTYYWATGSDIALLDFMFT